MAYTIPHYIVAANVDNPVLRYVWDDTRVDEDFRPPPYRLFQRMAPASLRAKVVIAIGIYEWIIWRFHKVSSDSVPLKLAEAAWAAAIDHRYLEYVELDREEWLGPVRGPLWCAITWLLPMLAFSDDHPEEAESCLSFLPALALHVLPDDPAFNRWLDWSVARLVELYPDVDTDPYADLFQDREEERRGPLIAREVLDPDVPYRPEQATPSMAEYLRGVDPSRNEFLRPPQALRAAGFEGVPYKL